MKTLVPTRSRFSLAWRRGAVALVALAFVATACGGDSLDADAGNDFTVDVGSAPTFDGCNSTGEINNYRWVIADAPDAQSGDEGKAIRETDSACSFTLESAMLAEEAGDWTIELIVTDGDGATASDEVTITVE